MQKQFSKFLIFCLIVSSFSFLNLAKASSESEIEEAVDDAVSYLVDQANSGDWVSEVGESGVDWSVMALAAAGAVSKIDSSVLQDALQTFSGTSATDYERKMLAITAIGQDPRIYIPDRNLVQEFYENFYTNNQIGNETQVNDDFWGILALISIGEDPQSKIIQESKAFILQHQNSDGGWGYSSTSAESDTDNTAAAIMALLSAGESSSSNEIQSAVSYLKSQQNENGGFSGYGSQESNSDSTSWVLASLSKLGQSVSDWKRSSGDPVDFLLSMQADDGYFYWQESSIASGVKASTPYAVIALLDKTFPLNIITSSKPLVSYRIEGSLDQVCAGSVEADNVMEVIENAQKDCGYSYELDYGDTYLKKLNSDEASGMVGWLYMVNWVQGSVGARDYELEDGDDVLWYYGEYDWIPMRLSVDQTELSVGDELEITVEGFQDDLWSPVEGATVFLGSSTVQTDSNGHARYSVSSFGEILPYAEKTGFIRSNRETVSVGTSSNHIDLKVKIKSPGSQTEPEISFTVTGESIDFGELEPGNASQDYTITIENTGQLKIDLGGIVEGDDIFVDNLTLDGIEWENYQLILDTDEYEDVNLGLIIPSDYNDEGEKEGELTFWAIEAK